MPMGEDHKAALAKGKREAAKVTRYLRALEAGQPGGAARAKVLEQKIERLRDDIANEDNLLRRVKLIQKRFDTEDKLKDVDTSIDFEALEADFIGVVVSYSERNQISYHTWREVGVPAKVLKAAAIKRTRRI